jgi:hypothetical protein
MAQRPLDRQQYIAAETEIRTIKCIRRLSAVSSLLSDFLVVPALPPASAAEAYIVVSLAAERLRTMLRKTIELATVEFHGWHLQHVSDMFRA